jgi:hypothetical protein
MKFKKKIDFLNGFTCVLDLENIFFSKSFYWIFTTKLYVVRLG